MDNIQNLKELLMKGMFGDDAIKTWVTGPTKKNPDGINRQKIIRKCKSGEEVMLVREPDNPYDGDAIAVFRESGEQIGYISKKHNKGLAKHLDKGGPYYAFVDKIIKESFGLFGLFKRNRCIIIISQKEIDHEAAINEIHAAQRKANQLKKSKLKNQTFRLQVIGKKISVRERKMLKPGTRLRLVQESDNKVSVFFRNTYLGYLYRSENIALQMEKGDEFRNIQVAGFYDDPGGPKLIIQVTAHKNP
jgi:hypothetical protein